MLRFSESLSLAVPPFFRKILVDLSQADEALLKIVDDHWKAGQIPDLLFLIKHISPGDPDDVIPDLMVWIWSGVGKAVSRRTAGISDSMMRC